MTGLLSIVWRELAVGARQTATHRGRLIAGAVVVTFFGLFVTLQKHPPNILGPMLFSISSMLLFLQALSSGIRYTADALSEEKREGTLGLLFLTELRAVEVVLGKMVARSLRGFYGMIATLPIFTFCILLGGIRGIDTLNMAVLLITTMLYSLAAGIFISSLVTEDKAAFLGTVGFVIALSAVPPIVWKIFSAATNSGALDFILYASPFYGLRTMPGVASLNSEFAKSILGLVVMTAVFLALAARNLATSFRRQFAEPAKAASKAEPKLRRHRARLEENPFRWLLERETLYARILFALAAVILSGSLIVVALTSKFGPGIYFTIGVNSLYFMHFLWKLLVVSDALRRLHQDRNSGALEQLLVTPLSVDQILSAQLRRTFIMFLPSAIALIIANVVFFTQRFVSGLFAVCVGGAILLFVDARALTWQAMLQALKPGRYPVAILRVAGVTLLPPILILMLILWSGTGGARSQEDVNKLFFLWFSGCAVYDVILIQSAKRKLREFRQFAAEAARPSKPRRPLPKLLQWMFLMEPAPVQSR